MDKIDRFSTFLIPASFFILPIGMARYFYLGSPGRLEVVVLAAFLLMTSTILGLRQLFRQKETIFRGTNIKWEIALQILSFFVGAAIFGIA
jgi:hypothetical protein